MQELGREGCHAGVQSIYDPESITSYEIGSKNRFFDDTVQLNMTAYYYDYKDQQVRQFNNGVTTIFNAGKSEIYGVEIEGVARFTPADQLDAFLGYMHARYTDFCTNEVNDVCQAGADFSGNRPPQAPTWQLGGGYEHEFNVANGAVTARIQSRYESASYMDFQNVPFQRQGGYTKTDIMVTYTSIDERWSVQAYGRNLEDSVVINWAAATGLWGTYTYSLAAPRTYGIRLTMNW